MSNKWGEEWEWEQADREEKRIWREEKLHGVEDLQDYSFCAVMRTPPLKVDRKHLKPPPRMDDFEDKRDYLKASFAWIEETFKPEAIKETK